MPQCNPFTMPGVWYKGALHVHTTCSDGRFSPTESMVFHRAHGYHFVAITDHGVITDMSGHSEPGFLLLPGIEINYDRNALGQSYHVVAVGVRTRLQVPPRAPIQEHIDRWAETGALLFLAHPYWSGMTVEELQPLECLAGVEVFNTSSQTDLGKGLGAVHWDGVLARGKRWWGYAVDDTHGINDDAAGGWVCVRSERLEEEAIVKALKDGAFYSSSGPEIHDFRIEGGAAYLRCSPATVINFVGHTQWGYQRRVAPGEAVVEAEYRLTGRERYLRAECVDAAGHAAWTNPIFLDESDCYTRG